MPGEEAESSGLEVKSRSTEKAETLTRCFHLVPTHSLVIWPSPFILPGHTTCPIPSHYGHTAWSPHDPWSYGLVLTLWSHHRVPSHSLSHSQVPTHSLVTQPGPHTLHKAPGPTRSMVIPPSPHTLTQDTESGSIGPKEHCEVTAFTDGGTQLHHR